MIIRTNVNTSTPTSASKKVEKKSEAVVEEVKPAINRKKKIKQNIPAPVIEETPVVEEIIEKSEEDEDLSKWLEEHSED